MGSSRSSSGRIRRARLSVGFTGGWKLAAFFDLPVLRAATALRVFRAFRGGDAFARVFRVILRTGLAERDFGRAAFARRGLVARRLAFGFDRAFRARDLEAFLGAGRVVLFGRRRVLTVRAICMLPFPMVDLGR